MTHPALRAIVFALFALAAWAIVSTAASLVIGGLPQQGESMAAYQARVAGPAATVDLVVGALALLLFGWLAARRYAGRDAILTALLLGIFYIAIEFGAAYLFAGERAFDVQASLIAYGTKLAGALLGGFVASRRPAPDEATVQDEP
jgi:hypothetical protein